MLQAEEAFLAVFGFAITLYTFISRLNLLVAAPLVLRGITEETLEAAEDVLVLLELEDFDEKDDDRAFNVVAGLVILFALLIRAAFAASFAA